MTHKGKSKVNIRKSGGGYIIEVSDQFTENILAITREELEQIVLYGQIVLKETDIIKQ